MGKVIMVDVGLSEQQIRAGESIIERLDQFPIIVDDVFWYRRSDEVDWKLVLTMPGLSFFGPLTGYGNVQRMLADIPDDILVPDLDQIILLDTNKDIVLALRRSLSAPFQRSHYGLSKVRLDRVYFEGFYVYRLADTISITCDLTIDPLVESSMRGNELESGDAYVSVRGFPFVPDASIITHGEVKIGASLTIEIEMPVKYGIESCRGLACRATMTMSKEGWRQPPPIYIRLVELAPETSV